MKNVFDKIGDISNSIHRNNFDWSHDNNFTTAFGRITPVLCENCPPNTSLRIKPTFGLKFLPMMFPVQTKVKAYLSFYRVPVRTLWKDYTDFISSPNDPSSTLEAPYIDTEGLNSPSMFKPGQMFGLSGLADYLGVPVSYHVDGYQGSINFLKPDPTFHGVFTWSDIRTNKTLDNSLSPSTAALSVLNTASSVSGYIGLLDMKSDESSKGVHLDFTIKYDDSLDGDVTYDMEHFLRSNLGLEPGGTNCPIALALTRTNTASTNVIDRFVYANRDLKIEPYTNSDGTTGKYYTISFDFLAFPNGNNYINLILPYALTLFRSTSSPFDKSIGDKSFSLTGATSFALTPDTNPYYDSIRSGDNKGIKLSAYPFRAYESVYNAYMRNIRNNPFMLDGKPVYNRFITNNEGGADKHVYDLYYANWASDPYTTAVPSPQQGQAPLVGLTTYTEQVALENGHVQNKLKFAVVDEDGKKYGVDFESNGEALKGVQYTELNVDTPVAPVSNLYDVVTSGISINDFRNVNAYQRYLELNMFRGYNYRDIIQGRFECNVHYDTLLMPEYLGGITRDVVINPVTQTVETVGDGSYNGALGSQAGDGVCFGQSDATISCFCDEESIVIGLLSVCPMPVYTQVLPKHFLYRDRLDTFNPEFDHIGFQPIYTEEICPIQQWASDPTKLKTVFGYQRPWYEYCQKQDKAHGLFLTQLRNFLINRVFSDVPELGSEFTTIDPDEVNDVFSVTDISDKILGQIHFDVTAKLPISRVVVPKIE